MLHSKCTLFLSLFIVLLGSSSCQTQSSPVLSGTISPQSGWKSVVYLVQPRHFAEVASGYSGVLIDSAIISADGKFRFDALPANVTPGLFQVCVQPLSSRFANQLSDDDPTLANYMPLVLEKGKSVQIQADIARFQGSVVVEQPSPENEALLHLRDLRHTSWRQHLARQEKPDENTLMEYEAAWARFRAPLMVFADSTRWLYPATVAIRWVSPQADYEHVPEFLSSQCRKWSPQNSDWARQLCAAASPEKLPVQVGQVIPDFALPSTSGDTVMLHSMLGARITVLDIWASWCAPCRRENRQVLAPLYQQYKNKGLQIIGYSIDSSKESWKMAIEKDGAVWPHTSHLSGDATPFMETLRLTTIPANFILDSTGKIIAKNLHGAELNTFVSDYLK